MGAGDVLCMDLDCGYIDTYFCKNYNAIQFRFYNLHCLVWGELCPQSPLSTMDENKSTKT